MWVFLEIVKDIPKKATAIEIMQIALGGSNNEPVKRHKWKPFTFTEGMAIGMKRKDRKVCVNCGVEKRQVINGMRYSYPDGTYKVTDKTPPCKPEDHEN